MLRARFFRLLVLAGLLPLSLGLYAAHHFQEKAFATDSAGFVTLAGEAVSMQGAYGEALQRLEERLAHYPDDHEASLLKGLLLFRSGHLNEARVELARLTARVPHFHLAHLVQGDLLLAATQSVTDIGSTPLLEQLQTEAEALQQLRAEAEVRLKGYLDALPGQRIPRALLMLGEKVRTALVVDKEHHRLYIYERQPGDKPPQLVRDYYISTGKANGNKLLRGDLRTPEGVYFITSHIPASRLPDKYGSGAFPLNYPNELDRQLGKTGNGIWLHGTETAFYSRPPLDSEGCVVLPNIDLERAAEHIHPGLTPLIIAARVEWVEEQDWLQERNELRQVLKAWVDDWASGDVELYLSHYAKDFWSPGFDLKKWQIRKRNVAGGKSFQKIALSNLSLFVYPDSANNGHDLVVANFHQRYRSNNFQSDMDKRLYLTSAAGHWQVLYEGGY